MRRYSSFLLMAVVIGWLSSPTYAILDDFEDGDYTNNPVWIRANPGYGVASVQADPIRPGNLALQVHGTDQAHSGLETSVNVPFAGFDYSADFLTTGYYGPSLQLHNANVWIDLYVGSDALHSPGFGLVEVIGGTDEHAYGGPTTAIPPNTWMRLDLWHDLSTNLVHGEVSFLSDGALFAELSFTPLTDLSSTAPISTARILAEETAWQYFDNVNLTSSSPTPIPAPGAAVLAMIGAGMVGWLRRRRAH